MIFNGYDFSQYWRVKKNPPLGPQVNVVERQIPHMAGARFVRTEIEPLDFDVDMRLKLPEGMRDPTTVSWVKRQAVAALITSEPAELKFYEEPTMVYQAVCTDFSEFDTPVFTGQVTISFHCCDPTSKYLMERVYNLSEGTNSVKIGGSWETQPTFSLTAKAGSSVKVEYDGMYVEAIGTFSAGDEVVIDCQKGGITVNGDPGRFDLESVFFALKPGVDTVKVTGATGTLHVNERSM